MLAEKPAWASTHPAVILSRDVCANARELSLGTHRPRSAVCPQVRFVRNVTAWREMKPGFYHGHVAYLDFAKYVRAAAGLGRAAGALWWPSRGRGGGRRVGRVVTVFARLCPVRRSPASVRNCFCARCVPCLRYRLVSLQILALLRHPGPSALGLASRSGKLLYLVTAPTSCITYFSSRASLHTLSKY